MFLEAEDWAELAKAHELAADAEPLAGSSEHVREILLGAVLDLEERSQDLAVQYEDLKDREGFNVRLEALKAAREHVSALPSAQVNQRGYRDHALDLPGRTDLELKIARYLLGERA
jgi:hypothetical protein